MIFDRNFNFTKILNLNKVKDYIDLMKLRLSLLVVFSCIIGYFFANSKNVDIKSIFYLFLGGFLVTISANAINQYIEKDSDKLMDRTKLRPLPTYRLSNINVLLFSGITFILGLLILYYYFNTLTILLSTISFISYCFLYTPLKRISSIAVFVGAFPGALPPLIGYVANTGYIDMKALWLFTIQFFWQFPHFWSIAWVLFNDYKKAGIFLLPSIEGKSKKSAVYILLYTAILVPLSIVPLYFEIFSLKIIAILLLISILFTIQAFKLFKNNNDLEAKKLMFYSFGYLTIFLLTIIF